MSMVEQFFSIKYAENENIFEGLNIWNDEKYKKLKGTYPVISLSFAGVKETTSEDAKEQIRSIIKLLCNDIKSMNAYMNHVALSCFSYFDTGNGVPGLGPERFYHGFVLGLLVELQEEYIITSNRESGYGRYDVMIEPRENEPKDAFILEFKVHEEEDEESLKETVAAALKQIEDKQYAA